MKNNKNKSASRLEYCSMFLMVLGIGILLLGIVLGIYFSLWNGKAERNCDDFNPCTIDKILPDSSCISRPFENGTSCSQFDVCYNSTAYPICNNGQCVGQREFCKGYCNVDADCPDLPWSYRLDDNPSGQCIAHSCVYEFISITDQCLSWLDNPPDNPLVLQNCLYSRFTTEFGPPVCFIRYSCALFDFFTPKMSIKNKPIRIKEEQNNLYNSTMMAISFFRNNKLDFPDLPTNPLHLITLHAQFWGSINITLSNYESKVSGFIQ